MGLPCPPACEDGSDGVGGDGEDGDAGGIESDGVAEEDGYTVVTGEAGGFPAPSSRKERSGGVEGRKRHSTNHISPISLVMCHQPCKSTIQGSKTADKSFRAAILSSSWHSAGCVLVPVPRKEAAQMPV